MITRRQFLTLAALLPVGAALAHAQARLRCPILMYHYIAEPPPDRPNTESLYVDPDDFDTHLARLQSDGFTTVTVAALAAALLDGVPLPEKPVALTFDDGHASMYASAYPLLRQYGMVATFYIVSTFMNQWWEYLTWGQAAEMASSGMEIGCHSATHVSLSSLGAEALSAEIDGAADAIESALGRRPLTFAYPFGHVNRSVTRHVREAGFRAAVTTRDGVVLDSSAAFGLPRIRVRRGHDADTIAWMANR